jgi:hypothetical protein
VVASSVTTLCESTTVVGHQNTIRDKNQRVLVGLIRSFWQGDVLQLSGLLAGGVKESRNDNPTGDL